MLFRKYENFVVNENETKDQILADAKLAVEVIQAQETNDIGWYINVVHPKRSYCSVVISDKIRTQYPTLAKNIDVYDEDEFLNDLTLINNRIDLLAVTINNSKSKLDMTAIVATTAKDNADTALIKATQAYTLAQSASGGTAPGAQGSDFKIFFYGGF